MYPVMIGNKDTMGLNYLEQWACSVLTYCYRLVLFGKNEEANPILKTIFLLYKVNF